MNTTTIGCCHQNMILCSFHNPIKTFICDADLAPITFTTFGLSTKFSHHLLWTITFREGPFLCLCDGMIFLRSYLVCLIHYIYSTHWVVHFIIYEWIHFNVDVLNIYWSDFLIFCCEDFFLFSAINISIRDFLTNHFKRMCQNERNIPR